MHHRSSTTFHEMKTVCAILLLVCAISAQRADRGHFGPISQKVQSNVPVARRQFGSSSQKFQPDAPSVRGQFGSSSQNVQSGASIDATLNGWEYNFSWLHTNNAKWEHDGAVNYCRSLPGNWAPISINDNEENIFVQNVLRGGRLDYIWTSGTGTPGQTNSWRWENGKFEPFGWSNTGGFRRPQPDNREGTEACLSVLNNIYPNDGITWHDVACYHKKPTICERPAKF